MYKRQEIYWHGLLDYSNEPGRKIEELRQIHSDFVKLGDVAGSRYQADFAVIRDYDNEWDGEFDRWHGEIRKLSEDGIFKASQYTHTPMDFLYLRKATTLEELSRYNCLLYTSFFRYQACQQRNSSFPGPKTKRLEYRGNHLANLAKHTVRTAVNQLKGKTKIL